MASETATGTFLARPDTDAGSPPARIEAGGGEGVAGSRSRECSINSEEGRLFDWSEGVAEPGRTTNEIEQNGDRPGRKAELSIMSGTCVLRATANRPEFSGAEEVNVVRVGEVGRGETGEDEDAIVWVLLTTEPVETFEEPMTDFETARLWCGKLDRYDMAVRIRDRDQFPEANLVLIDYDSVRRPATARLHPTVWEQIKRVGSDADISPSQSGVHIPGRGELPREIRAISDSPDDADHFPNAEIEVYDSARYVAMTGAHVANPPLETRHRQDFIDDLAENFATTTESPSDHDSKRAEPSRESTGGIEVRPR